MINSLTDLAVQKKYFARWEFLGAYSGCMIGNPAIAMIADAYAKGIRNFDVEKAYQIAVNTGVKFGNENVGYVPVGKGYSVSETLEYAYCDGCMSQWATALGKADDARYYAERARFYTNIFDTAAMFFRPKKQNGEWEEMPPEGRLQEWYGCIESNPYQQGWFVPHDVEGMVALMGGRERVLADLTAFFDSTPHNFLWNKYYNHANEPVHHVPFLFNRLGEPHLTQKWTRTICANAYHNSVEGLVGNEDVGQMSAWYVLAAAGFHPVCPGSTRYEITSPVFDKIIIATAPSPLERGTGGEVFSVIAYNNSAENMYIQRAALNGKPYNHCYIDHADIARGGVLELWMDKIPNYDWGISKIY
jgi:predicted alpha-1,2-mannosidase